MLRYLVSVFVFAFAGLFRVIGLSMRSKRLLRLAVRLFGAAHNLSDRQREARLARAVLNFRELGQPEIALTDLDALLEEDESYADARMNRVLVLQEIGRYADALADVDYYINSPYANDEYLDLMMRTAIHLRALVEE